jgi:hypothetical protein
MPQGGGGWYLASRRAHKGILMRNEGMQGSRLRSALRSTLHFLGAGLMWLGVSFGLDSFVAAEAIDFASGTARPAIQLGNVPDHPDQLLMTPLSRAERAEWAALVERLR